MRKSYILLLLLFLPLAGNAQLYQTADGYARFKAEAPLNSYTGEANDLTGSINIDTKEVSFRLNVKSLDTDNDKRNRDMYDLMEVNKYPTINFNGKIIDDLDLNGGKQKVKVMGKMTIRGVTRDVLISGTIGKNGDKLAVETSWTLRLSDYNIEQPDILFYEVEDEHNIYISATLQKK